MYPFKLNTNEKKCNSEPEMGKLEYYYHSDKETLSFQVSKIFINVNPLRRIYFSGAIIIRHYRNDNLHSNCFQDNIPYLNAIFKEYFSQNQSKTSSLSEQKKCAQRTVFLAQFQPFLDHIQKNVFEDFPTYAVSYEMKMLSEDLDKTLQISFRPITQHSFLVNVLEIFSQPILEEKTRRCVLIESVNNNKNENNRFIMKALTMPITNNSQMIDKRLFLVAKNGWLAVFVDNYSDAFLLTENEYLIFPNHLKHLPIFYERIIDMNQAKNCSELFYRRTSVNHDQYSCSGMIVSRGVIQNEFKQNCFTLIGLGNAIINFSFFQELLTISNYKTKQ